MGNSKYSKADNGEEQFLQGIVHDSLSLDEDAYLARVSKRLRRMQHIGAPVISGEDNIPDAPALFVANHSTMATDTIIVMPMLAQACGRMVRGMNDRLFYESQRLRELAINYGAVLGDQAVGSAMFEAGKDLLVFPGGAYEANKRQDQRYKILWKNRTGFVRLAARHGVPIVPVGIVGPDDWYDRYLEQDQVRNSVLGRWLLRAGVSEEFLQSDELPPIPKGFMGTWLPKPRQVFVHIGKPISTRKHKGRNIRRSTQERLRDQAREGLESAIDQMLALREKRRQAKTGWHGMLDQD